MMQIGFFFQGKLGEALKLFEQALQIYEENLGGSHPKVAESLRNIAKVHLDLVRERQTFDSISFNFHLK